MDSVQLFAFFFFFLGTPNYEGRVLHDSFRSRGHATPPLERGTTWRALDSWKGRNEARATRSQNPRSRCSAWVLGTGRSVYERACHGNTVVDTTPTLPFAAGQHQKSGCRARLGSRATPAFFDAIGSPHSVVTNLIINRTSLFTLAGNGMRSSKKRGSRLL